MSGLFRTTRTTYLLLMFDCHICVDVVTATSCANYLFKYVHKGADYAKARIQGITSEIEQYRKTRYIHICRRGVWRLLGYQMVSRFPAVTQIHAHLEGEHYVTYPDDATPEMFLEIADNFPSSLMTYFRRATDALFDKLTHWTATNSSPSQSRRKNCQNRHAHHQGGS